MDKDAVETTQRQEGEEQRPSQDKASQDTNPQKDGGYHQPWKKYLDKTFTSCSDKH